MVAMADLMVDMEVMEDPMVDMEAMAMARGRLMPPLMLSLAMDTAAMADLMVDMEVMAGPMEDIAMAMESKSFFKPLYPVSLTLSFQFSSMKRVLISSISFMVFVIRLYSLNVKPEIMFSLTLVLDT